MCSLLAASLAISAASSMVQYQQGKDSAAAQTKAIEDGYAKEQAATLRQYEENNAASQEEQGQRYKEHLIEEGRLKAIGAESGFIVDDSILTYLFHGSTMASYLSAGNVYPQMMAVQDSKLVSWGDVDEASIKERLRSCITVYEGPGNRIGTPKDKENPLSVNWYKRADIKELEKLRASTEHFFKSIAGTPSKYNCWTTFKAFRTVLSGKGYTKGFLPNNLRATNDYIDKKSSAYLCNTFLHTYVRGHFIGRGILVYEDLYALSEMLQWLWRGQIRRFDPITVFIPSERMRRLLISWLESDTVEDLFQRVGYGMPLKMAA